MLVSDFSTIIRARHDPHSGAMAQSIVYIFDLGRRNLLKLRWFGMVAAPLDKDRDRGVVFYEHKRHAQMIEITN